MHYFWHLYFEWLERHTMAATARGALYGPIVAGRVMQRKVTDVNGAIHEEVDRILAGGDDDPLRPLPTGPAALDSTDHVKDSSKDGERPPAAGPTPPAPPDGPDRRGPGRPKKLRPEDLTNDRP